MYNDEDDCETVETKDDYGMDTEYTKTVTATNDDIFNECNYVRLWG